MKTSLTLRLLFSLCLFVLFACKKGDTGPSGQPGIAGSNGSTGATGATGSANVAQYQFGTRNFSDAESCGSNLSFTIPV